MKNKNQGLAEVGLFLRNFLAKDKAEFNQKELQLWEMMQKSHRENPWFTPESLRLSLWNWAENLTEKNIENWLYGYQFNKNEAKVGLVLAGNIPMVGLHDVVAVLLSGKEAVIKLSSKDKNLIPFILELWQSSTSDHLKFSFVERLQEFDAVIATGTNNTAHYLGYYFKDKKNIIRKNRTSVGVLTLEQTDEELKLLANDIFHYHGLGCRNVTRLFLPKDFGLDRLFENFLAHQDIVNHHQYANNYDYNKAIYLLNRDVFWDNNFVMLKEDNKLFSPLAVINFSRYENLDEVKEFLTGHADEIQCIVSRPGLLENSIAFGEAQNPPLNTYADNVDTLEFLSRV